MASPLTSVTAARAASECVGDCDGSGIVTVNELVSAVNIALGNALLPQCQACDCNHTGQVTVDCLVKAVNAALNGCSAAPVSTASPTPTPTPTSSPTPTSTVAANPDATLANIQANIFSTTCIDLACHSSLAQAGNLVLEPGLSHDQLVDVASFNFGAQQLGLLRVKPGDPDNSFLVIKLSGPPLAEGAPMPSGKAPLTAAQLQLIRDWVTQGALP